MNTKTLGESYLIGFCSRSLKDKDHKLFADIQIKKNLFEDYRERLKELSGESDSSFGQLYNPKLYYLWGKYDICAISEIDDLEFATRSFRSFNPIHLEGEEELLNFDYKVAIGTSPIRNIKPRDKDLPFIAICQVKINSVFLIGNGRTAIDGAKKYIKSIIEKYSDHEIDYRICESFSYHELILILNSNSLYLIKEILLKVRSTRIMDFVSPFSQQQSDDFIEKSLFRNLVSSKANIVNSKEIENHLFESTLTTLGTHYLLFSDTSQFNSEICPPIDGEVISIFSRWNLKPGHYKETFRLFESLGESQVGKYFIIGGRGDLFIEKQILISSDDNFKSLDYPAQLFKSENTLRSNIIDTFSSLSINPNNKGDSFDKIINTNKHYDIHSSLEKFIVNTESIKHLRTELRSLLVPKVLSEKILKLISNYNNAVLNPDMYASYVELFSYINYNFIETVKYNYNRKNERGYDAQNFFDTLNESCNSLEAGLQNRFYQSYWTSEVPEVNTDYSGGVQNLLSAYDACYKGLNCAFKGDVGNSSFVFVKSDSDVNSAFEDLKMNYLHLIQPINYCSIVSHECCNFALDKWFRRTEHEVGSDPEWLTFSKRILRQFYIADIPFEGASITEEEMDGLFPDAEKICNEIGGPYKYIKSISEILSYNNLISFISPKALRYHLISRINFQFAFQKDFEFFKDTHWNYIFQMGHIYNKASEIHTAFFLSISIRLGLLKFSVEKGNVSFDEFQSIYPESPIVRPLIDKFGNDLYLFIKGLFDDKNSLQDWLLEWENIFEYQKYQIIPSTLERYQELGVSILNYFKFNSEKQNSEEPTIYSELERIITDTESVWDAYLLVTSAYLKANISSIVIMERNSLNSEPIGPIEKDKINIDPCGGTFVVGSAKRKEYLIQRLKFTNLLYHLSLIYKKKYINAIFKNSDSDILQVK